MRIVQADMCQYLVKNIETLSQNMTHVFQTIRITHYYDENGQEMDKDGKPIKKKVDILRLISLAKPVSFFWNQLQKK